jgi:ATP-dependent Lhr-like helicase
MEWRFILTESFGRYAAAFGDERVARVRVGRDLVEMDAAEVVPEVLRRPVITPPAARREILARFLALSGPVTIGEIEARYGWEPRWIESKLTEWQRTGKLVVGKFRREVPDLEWCSKRVAEIGRRRALAALRKQIEAVDLHVFAEMLQRWQHVDPRDRLQGVNGVATAMRQLYGLARPAVGWERDYLRSRVVDYNPALLSQLATGGELVWVAATAEGAVADGRQLSRVQFFERGTGNIWLAENGMEDEEVLAARLTEEPLKVLRFIRAEGASFINDIQNGTGLSPHSVRRSLRELASLGLVTNDTIEALREVIRWRALPTQNAVDPTKWLPADFTPSANRRVVQRRPNLRRLPKWKRPDRPGGAPGSWSGRWSLVWRASTLGMPLPEEARAATVARQWLDRYGIVTRECWKRERPPISWRSIYLELKKLEFRGEARRGYFVKGLSGAQFAAPAAVELLRSTSADDSGDAPFVVLSASDPANVYNMAINSADQDPLSRPRGGGALLVTRRGKVAIAVEGRGRRITIAEWMKPEEVEQAKELLSVHLRGEKGARYLMLPDIRPT